ncbi:MAG TPA: YciI family protein [Myxococcaceae bacterium]|nr:YciI family protein [Myxococcaceae bacterium]
MKAILVTLALLLSGADTAPTPPRSPSASFPKGMKQYFMGFLVRGEKNAEPIGKDELNGLQQQHLAYIRSQAEAGRYALAGPLLDNDRIRGILMINAASAEEAKNIASGDPMVKNGRLAVEIHPFMVADLSCVFTEYQKVNPTAAH